ncbi:YciI family protein [Naasia aerilata]|uniref:YCII-related domain-containing protein n=1 Tax=Naasia aerilata TaxID=1162966 RepID=A0ABM8G812_9MICO|nr:YciI family protein [Naasia aerilata]BDZ44323.1 hypothetical protein GCM10025866_02320 [Naasia aerilata]
MKYMLVMAQAPSAADIDYTSPEALEAFDAMGKFNEELISAGVLLSAEGLSPESEGVRIDYDGDERTITDGPFSEAKEVFYGFWILETATQEEAVEWARRAPLQVGSVTVRRVPSIDEFDLDNEHVQKEREWRISRGEKLGA